MDELKKCAEKFRELLNCEYYIVLGKKKKTIEINLAFDESDFHHLVGLHKLVDNDYLHLTSRRDIFNQILSGKITISDLRKSCFFNEIQLRLSKFTQIQSYLDSNETVYRYNSKYNSYSLIQADFLFLNDIENFPTYLFINKSDKNNKYFCRSFFPKGDIDYTKGQAKYTLLYKEKINLITGDSVVQYHHPKYIISDTEQNEKILIKI